MENGFHPEEKKLSAMGEIMGFFSSIGRMASEQIQGMKILSCADSFKTEFMFEFKNFMSKLKIFPSLGFHHAKFKGPPLLKIILIKCIYLS